MQQYVIEATNIVYCVKPYSR